MRCRLGVIVISICIGCSNDRSAPEAKTTTPAVPTIPPAAKTTAPVSVHPARMEPIKSTETAGVKDADTKSSNDTVSKLRDSLETYQKNCNARIETVEARFGKKTPVTLTPGKIDIKKTDSALNPYNGVLTLLITREGAEPFDKYEFQFTLKPLSSGEWEYVSCYGGPAAGKFSEWTLKQLYYQFEAGIGLSWLLGYDETKAMFDAAGF